MFGSGMSRSRFCACGDRREAGIRFPSNCRRSASVAAAGRIEDVDAQAAEIALTLGRCWHAQQRRPAGVAPRPLIVAEEEQLVLRDRTAERGAELIPLRDRNVAIGADESAGTA